MHQMRGNNFSRLGPDIVLVTRESATGDRCFVEPSMTIQIDENHSDMVKFFNGDHRIRVIASKLSEVCNLSHISLPAEVAEESSSVYEGIEDRRNRQETNQQSSEASAGAKAPISDPPLVWDDKSKYSDPVGALDCLPDHSDSKVPSGSRARLANRAD